MSSLDDGKRSRQAQGQEARTRYSRGTQQQQYSLLGNRHHEGRFSERTSEYISILNGVNTMGCVVTVTFMIVLFLSSSASGQRQNSRDTREAMAFDPSKETLGTVNLPPMPSRDASNSGAFSEPKDQNRQPVRAAGLADESQNQMISPSAPAPCRCPAGNQAKGGNVATAAATLGALMWAGGQIPQMSKVWKSKNAQSYSAMTLFFQLGASFLCGIYALLSGSFTLTMFSMMLFGSSGLYLFVYIKHPTLPAQEEWNLQNVQAVNDEFADFGDKLDDL